LIVPYDFGAVTLQLRSELRNLSGEYFKNIPDP